jgi:transcriptional regulator with XRE-family HTH domain
MTPGPLIRKAREEAGLTQAELAERLGISQPAVARLERPQANPTFTTFMDALAATGHRLELRRQAIPDVDEGQILEMLRLTPAQRLQAFMAGHRNLAQFLAKAERVDAAPS